MIALINSCVLGMELNNKGFYPKNLSAFCTLKKPYGAGVMPYYEDEKGEQYVLIGREINSPRKEWAFFSGGSEESLDKKGEMEHPLECATREFYEEAIIGKTLGLDQEQLKEYIKNNTTEVIAEYARDINFKRPLIIYMVKFTKDDIITIISKFNDIFKDTSLEEKYREKDALAVIHYQHLITTIKKNEWYVNTYGLVLT